MVTFENGIDIRARDAKRPEVAKFNMGDGTYRYVVIGTDYGYVHTSGGDVRTWATPGGARAFIRKVYTDWKHVPSFFRSRNPKLDFFGHDGAYLYSSNFYQCIEHAWAHVARNLVTGYSVVATIKRSAA